MRFDLTIPLHLQEEHPQKHLVGVTLRFRLLIVSLNSKVRSGMRHPLFNPGFNSLQEAGIKKIMESPWIESFSQGPEIGLVLLHG